MVDLSNRIFVSSEGKVYFFAGRGSLVPLGSQTLDEVLASFDKYVAWVAAGNGNQHDRESATPQMRNLLIDTYVEAVHIAAHVAKVLAEDPEPTEAVGRRAQYLEVPSRGALAELKSRGER